METKRIYLFRLFLVAAVLSLHACQVKKNLSTYKSSSAYAEEKNTAIETGQTELLENSRTIHIIDSADHSYRVTILPADTFTYSPQEGFQGRARQVEITGRQKREIHVADSMMGYSFAEASSKMDVKARMTQSRELGSKVKEKEGGIKTVWITIGIVVVLGLVAAGLLRKYI